ncbi:MAG: glycosyltransferase [Actinomycetes bacterium]
MSVVVVTYESAATIAAALGPLRESSHVGRVVVVDNHSTDDSAALAAAAGADEVLVLDANLGFAAANNRGLRLCTGESVLFLNPDASIEGEHIDRLVAALRSDSRAVAAGPVLEGQDGRLTSGARRFSTVWNRLAVELPWFWRHDRFTSRQSQDTLQRAAGRAVPVDYVWGAAVLVRRDFLDSIGGLDERFFLYHEDEDLGRRVLLVTAARANHIGAVSSGGDVALAHARMLFATSQLLEKWSWPSSGRVFAVSVQVALLLQTAAATISGDSLRRTERSRCARYLRAFRQRGSARP